MQKDCRRYGGPFSESEVSELEILFCKAVSRNVRRFMVKWKYRKSRRGWIPMGWLPSIGCVLQCSRTPEEIRRILEFVTVQQNRKFFGQNDGEFTGTVSDSGFELVPRLPYRNSFVPIIRGWVETDGERSKIWIKMRLHPAVAVFCRIWFGFMFFGLLCGLPAVFTEGILSALPLIFQELAMAGLGLLLVRCGFQRPANRSLERLKELVGGAGE